MKKLEHSVLQFIQEHAHRQAHHTATSVYRKIATAMDPDTFEARGPLTKSGG